MIKVLYPCDPNKNTECKKDSCGDLCTLTEHRVYAKEGFLFKDLKIIHEKEITFDDYLFLKALEMEVKE